MRKQKRIEEKTDKQLDVAIDELLDFLMKVGILNSMARILMYSPKRNRIESGHFSKKTTKRRCGSIRKSYKAMGRKYAGNHRNGQTPKISSHDYYMNSAGEIEARDVSNRLYFTEEQIRNIRPDIDNDAAIVRFSLKNKKYN